MLAAAAAAPGRLGARLGAYPYPTFKVVQSAGAYGMESPRLVWIPTGTPSGNLRYLVAHETAHQWFYGLVGNDQSRHPFADEAAADAVTRKILGMRRASHCATGRLDRSIYSYTSACYYEIVYIQGGNLLDTVRTRMGTTVWWNALKSYVAANRYGLVDQPDAARRARRRDAAEPASRRSGRGSRASTEAASGASRDPAVRGERLRHLPERGREQRPPRPPARDQPVRDHAVRAHPTAGRTRRGRPAAGGRSTARGSRHRPPAGRRSPASTPGSGGCRIVSASSRASGPTRTGPSGREHPGDVRVERVEVRGQERLGDPERPADRPRLLVVRRGAIAARAARARRRWPRSSSRPAWRGPTATAPGRGRRTRAR